MFLKPEQMFKKWRKILNSAKQGTELADVYMNTFAEPDNPLNTDEVMAMYELKRFELYPGILDSFNPSLNSIYGALAILQNFENEYYGRVITDLGNPIKIANKIDQIHGRYVFKKLLKITGLNELDEIGKSNKLALLKAVDKLEAEYQNKIKQDK